MRFTKFFNQKGFTLMELLVTVILVAVLASYSVYYYNNTIDEGKLHAAKGKLAALGGALERFKLENHRYIGCSGAIELTSSNIVGTCDVSNFDSRDKLLNVFYCGYAEKSLALDDNFRFYIGCPSECNVQTFSTDRTAYVAIMKPKTTSSVFPTCAYFDPNHDKVVEVE